MIDNVFTKYIKSLYTEQEIRRESKYDSKASFTAVDAFLRDWNLTHDDYKYPVPYNFNKSITALVRKGGTYKDFMDTFAKPVTRKISIIKLSKPLIKKIYFKAHVVNAQDIIKQNKDNNKRINQEDIEFRGHTYRPQSLLDSYNQTAMASQRIADAFENPSHVLLRDDDVKRAGYINCNLKRLVSDAIKD